MATATKAPAKKVAAPAKKAAAKAAGPVKKAAARSKVSDEEYGRHDLKPFGFEDQVVKLRGPEDEPLNKWDAIADQLNTSTGKVLLAHGIATVGKNRLKGTPEERSAHVPRLRDEEDMSWGQIMIITGLNEGYVRSRYTELTGKETRGLNLGRGGRRPNDWDGEEVAAKPAKKAAAKKAAAAAKAPPKKAVASTGKTSLTDLDVDGLRERLEGAAILVQRGDKTETIEVSKVQSLTKGAVTVTNKANGAARTFKVADITKVGKRKSA